MPPAMLVLHSRPSRLLGAGFSKVLRNSITIKMVLGIVLFFAGMSSLYVNHRLGLSLAGAGLVLVFVPAEFLFGLCIDFKGHKEPRSRSNSTKSDSQLTDVTVKTDKTGSVTVVTAAETVASDVLTEDDQLSSSPDIFETMSTSRYFTRKVSPPATSSPREDPKFHQTRSAVLRLQDGDGDDVKGFKTVVLKGQCNQRTDQACKFHRTRSAVIRSEEVAKAAAAQIVRFNLGTDADDPPDSPPRQTTASPGKPKSASIPSGPSGARSGSASGAVLARGASVDASQQSNFHRSKSAVMHRSSVSNEEPSSTKSSPTRTAKATSQSANTSPYRERSTVTYTTTARVQQIQQMQQQQQQQVPAPRGGRAWGSDGRPGVATQVQQEPTMVKTSFSDLSNEHYTRFHRIRAAAQLQQAAATPTSNPALANRKKEQLTVTPTTLTRTRSMTSRSSGNSSQQQDNAKSGRKSDKDKKSGSISGAKENSATTGSSDQELDETSPRLRRTSSGPSRRPARTSKELTPWTSLAVQTTTGVIAILCRARGSDLEASSSTSLRERRIVERSETALVRDEGPCLGAELGLP